MVKHKKMFKFENIQMYKMFNNFVKKSIFENVHNFQEKKQRTKKNPEENQLNQKRAKNHQKHKTKRSNKTITWKTEKGVHDRVPRHMRSPQVINKNYPCAGASRDTSI
jgi:hypothetical protein